MTSEIEVKQEITDLRNPKDAIELANALTNIIVKKDLSVQLPGKKLRYITVEGWQLAGALCGIFPMVEKVENISDEKRICYRAEVTLRDVNNEVVGTGVAICTNQEKGKERFGEYAICSMAQTRATGKALRLKLGWLMKLAGFQATPVEEMGRGGAIEEIDADEEIEEVDLEPEVVQADYAAELTSAKDLDSLYRIWIRIPKEMKDSLKDLKDEMKNKLQGANDENH